MKICLETMFCVTNTIALAKAMTRPRKLALKSAEHAKITPSVRGINDRYVGTEYEIPKKKRYARTVMSGDSPLIVCTKDTGILDVASALRMCPPIMNAVRGSVATIISLCGRRIPYFRNGIVCFMRGYRLAKAANIMHHPETNANWTVVRVIGFGSAVRMVFEDMFVKMEVMYQTPQSA